VRKVIGESLQLSVGGQDAGGKGAGLREEVVPEGGREGGVREGMVVGGREGGREGRVLTSQNPRRSTARQPARGLL